ncbi:MAG: hypothetical protein HQ527_01935 [Cyanobacteria bacterium]|nr:hypothetical protein [Cyanobacteria bacterium bin.51]
MASPGRSIQQIRQSQRSLQILQPRLTPWSWSNGWNALLALVFSLGLCASLASPAWGQVVELDYRCDGDPLAARYDSGPVDDPLVGNVSAGTIPGAFAVLRWREVSLQLPRSNDAGPPQYTDGKWFWGLEDPAHPRFLLNSGAQYAFACEALNAG